VLPKFTEEDEAHVAAMREKGREAMGIKKIARRFEDEIMEVWCVRACVLFFLIYVHLLIVHKSSRVVDGCASVDLHRTAAFSCHLVYGTLSCFAGFGGVKAPERQKHDPL